MSKRHEAVLHLKGLQEIKQIMGSMQTLALQETRKLERFLTSQQETVRTIEAMAADFGRFYPLPAADTATARRVFLLLGSERGFCGDFNQALARALEKRIRDEERANPLVLAVGRKLSQKLAGAPHLAAALEGASVAEELERVLARLVEALNDIRARYGPFTLTVLHHPGAESGVRSLQLLPPFTDLPVPPSFWYAPELNLPSPQFLAALLEQYLFSALNGLMSGSLMAESRRRLQHLERAVNHLEERIGRLSIRINSLRQEEIIEEIEVILLSTVALREKPFDFSG